MDKKQNYFLLVLFVLHIILTCRLNGLQDRVVRLEDHQQNVLDLLHKIVQKVFTESNN